MRRLAGVVFGLALCAPTLANAQSRPANTMHTNSAELYFERARRSNREDEKQELLQKALDFALDGIKAKADNPKAYLLAGKIYVQMSATASADSMFDKAEQLWPEYAKETEQERMQAWVRSYNAGVVAMRANNLEEGVKQFESAAAIYNRQPGAQLNLAQIYARQNQPEKSIAAYQAALAIIGNPENSKGLKPEELAQYKEFEEAATFNLAQQLAATGKNDEAVAAFREYLGRNPNNTLAKSNLAVTLSRMGKADEAATIYAELLSQDLTADEYFTVGVGLFRATQHKPAAEAFRKAVGKNAYMRDAWYNLAQALYSQANDLDDQKARATGDAAAPIVAQLNAINTELAQVTETLRGMDPLNRNVIALQSRAYRALGELTTDAKAAADWKTRTLDVLKANEALAFTVEDVTIATSAEGVQVSANVVNQKGTAGQSVKLRFQLLGAAGQAVDTQEVTVALPEVQGAAPIKLMVKASTIAGWKYEAIQ